MASDEWPRIVCERFDGESDATYAQRAKRIREIITAFRLGRIRPEIAEDMEQELVALQEPSSLWSVTPERQRRVA